MTSAHEKVFPSSSTPIRLKTKVYRPYRGRTVLEFLCERFRYLPRETWIDRLGSGRIRLNGVTATSDMLVEENDVVEYEIDAVEPDVDFTYDLIYEDDDLIAVSKSGNIPVHASGSYIRNTLIARMREDLGENVHLAHRLDRETSGVLLLARNMEARRNMGRAFEEGLVEKSYIAIVRGKPSEDVFTSSLPLRKIGKQHPIPRTVVADRTGKPAITRFRVLERLGAAGHVGAGERLRGFSVIEAQPTTGRTNQIRVHLEAAGYPIVGDKTYGLPARLLRRMVADADDADVRAHLILPRHALHHARMCFAHPVTGVRVAIEAPVPKDMRAFIKERRTG
ncbi:RluA family pseudouridine synthase [bacterium]|nr:RluA family pseudouridine synthase [bacterium]